MLHLQTPSSARVPLETEAPWGSSGVLHVLEQGSREVLPKEARVFMSSDVTHDLVLAFCSDSGDNVPDDRLIAVDEAFLWMDRLF